MKLTPNDICGLECKIKTTESSSKTREIEIENKKGMDENGKQEDEDGNDDDEEDTEGEGYNPNWTLRKCCSKLLDKLSRIFHDIITDTVKPFLEADMQDPDWVVKERSILALGAIAEGGYNNLKHHLSTLAPFLIRELQHPNKLVRAISCWTLSRFTKFILIDNLSSNSYNLFKDYLCEILKKFLDPEIIVQEAACTAFSCMVMTKKEILEPYLFDIFKIITSVFEKYKGTSLLTLYDIISLLTDNYEDHFINKNLVDDLVKCIVRKLYEMLKNHDLKNATPIIDMTCLIIKASGVLLTEYFDYFISSAMIIIESNYTAYLNNNQDATFINRELVSKSLDLISILCQSLPECIKNYSNKNKIVEYMFLLINTGEFYLKHYIIALFGDLCKIDANLLKPKFKELIDLLVYYLEVPELTKFEDMEKLSACNNSCWTLGLLSLYCPNEIRPYILQILKKLLKVISLPRVINFK